MEAESPMTKAPPKSRTAMEPKVPVPKTAAEVMAPMMSKAASPEPSLLNFRFAGPQNLFIDGMGMIREDGRCLQRRNDENGR